MTAGQERTAKVPPRVFIRTAWVLHRALLRFSGGRIGLRPPGKSFGMLRLETVGRRSGQSRVAIVGYLEDGQNLVTLAMNGWGEAEPAWWLNLQAQPDTTVELKDGRRAVRGRAAEGGERDRLWARWESSAPTTTPGPRCAPGRPPSWCSSRVGPQRSPGSHDRVKRLASGLREPTVHRGHVVARRRPAADRRERPALPQAFQSEGDQHGYPLRRH